MEKVVTPTAKIKLLPDYLINQIAAGEVIERPASVVKELLDNSLDSGASEVLIDVEHGGVGLIRIKDNGSGIHRDELKLALTRHATSKIRQLDDLRKLITMGFRGEALPSIASISRLQIISKLQSDEHAWTIKSEGRDDLSEPEPTSHPTGTTIEIRDLFFNVPARRKYLRAERTEFYQIQQLVKHFAISHPEISVRLTHNGRQVFNLKSIVNDNGQTRVRDVCGKKFMENSYRIDMQDHELNLTGWVGNSDAARTMNDAQFFCLNGRCIRDKRINHAIQQAYQGVLPEGRYATYALYFEMDPTMVDVNVHPAKTEVRFREGRMVHDFIYSALNRVLSDEKYSLPEIPLEKITTKPTLRSVPSSRSNVRSIFDNSVIKESRTPYYPELKPIENQNKSAIDSVTKTDQVGDVVVIKNNEKLILVNVKKIAIELCKVQIQDELKKGSLFSKPLLFPHGIDLNENEVELVSDHLKLLNELGIILIKNVNNTDQCQLRELPVVISTENNDQLISKVIKVLQENDLDQKAELINVLANNYSQSFLFSDPEILLEKIDQNNLQQYMRTLSEDELLNLIKDQK